MFVFSIVSCIVSVLFTLFYLFGYIFAHVSRDIDEEDKRQYDILFMFVLCGVLWFTASLLLALMCVGVIVV